MKKRAVGSLILFIMVLSLLFPALPVLAATTGETNDGGAELIEIHTVEDLQAMAEDPEGSYILMEDLDMTGVDWKCMDFRGSFDGNGHAILNLYLSQPGETTADSVDGNRKRYETSYVGLFGTLQDATITNLNLINVRGLVDIDSPCFLAAMAGYSKDSTITNCTVTGCLELRAFDRMFGVGGVVGYGSGTVQSCKIDVTLICTDTDATTRDEQFMGGVYATGFMDVKDCEIIIDGYVSEHGYVHNGGIVGMYMEYPLGVGKTGRIMRNSVTGKITFFEDNTNRRAYCKPFVGEALVDRYYLDNNTEDFLRDERKDYSVELRPEMCENPVYTETVTAPGCDTYGYITYQCQTCGYTYTDRYTLFSHTVTNWVVTLAPTTEATGLSTGSCDGCGKSFQREEPMLEPVPTETTQPETIAPAGPAQPEPEEGGKLGIVFLAVGAAALLAAAGLLIALLKASWSGRYAKPRSRKRSRKRRPRA